MNVFNSLMVYAGKWILKSKRTFAAEEIAAVSKAEVVSSQYGNSACFHEETHTITILRGNYFSFTYCCNFFCFKLSTGF